MKLLGFTLVCDAFSDKVYKLVGFSTSIEDSFSTSGFNAIAPSGLTWDGDNVLLSCTARDAIFKLAGFSSTVLDSISTLDIDTGATYPCGLAWDGSNTLFCDGASKRLYQLDGFSTTLLNSFSATDIDPSAVPLGLGWDGEHLLYCDNYKNALYRLDGFSSEVVDSIATTDIESGAHMPAGAAFDGSNVLFSDINTDKLYQLDGFGTAVLKSFSIQSIDPLAGNPSGLEYQRVSAQVTTYLYTGETPTGSEISTLFLNTDDSNVETFKVAIPKSASSSHFSFWKHVSLYLTDWGDYSQINNIKFYCDGAIDWEGCTLRCAQVANYTQATGVVGETGDEASTNHADTPTMLDVQNYTEEAPLSLEGSLQKPNTGKVLSGYLLLQLEVSATATAGTLPEESLLWEFDEV